MRIPEWISLGEACAARLLLVALVLKVRQRTLHSFGQRDSRLESQFLRSRAECELLLLLLLARKCGEGGGEAYALGFLDRKVAVRRGVRDTEVRDGRMESNDRRKNPHDQVDQDTQVAACACALPSCMPR